MKITIIIPGRNCSKTITKTIDSVFKSNNINKYYLEIIYSDDFSLDGSHELVKRKYPTVKVLLSKKQKGAAYARNRGIKEAKGDFLLFIDSDAWFNKTTIDALTKKVRSDIVFPKIVYENGHKLYPVFEIEKKYPHISGCFLIRKKSLEKLDEYFDEFYETYLEDYDFFIRCKLAGLKAEYVDATVTHANKLSKDFSERYGLEVRNTFYGIKKLANLANKSKLLNPFKYRTLVKMFFLGMFNFAWFNWQGYYRDSTFRKKISLMLSKKNKISQDFNFLKVFFVSIFQVLKQKSKVKEKSRQVRKFYNKEQ